MNKDTYQHSCHPTAADAAGHGVKAADAAGHGVNPTAAADAAGHGVTKQTLPLLSTK